MKVLIFGGTTEGRELAVRLSNLGYDTTVSVATQLGAEELEGNASVRVLVGRKTDGEMAELLGQFDACIDATHPYAVLASENIRKACEQAKIPMRRMLRAEGKPVEGLRVQNAQQAAELLSTREGNILLTTGAKELPAFSGIAPERLFPRVLPVLESITACKALEIPTKNIIAMHGPFSLRLNEAILEQYHIRFLVTKDGGRAGGFEEKVEAARNMGTELVIIERPRETGESQDQVVEWLRSQG